MEKTTLFPLEGSSAAFRRSIRVVRAEKEIQEPAGAAGAWREMAYPPVRYQVAVIRSWQHAALAAAEGRVTIDPKVMDGVPVVRGTRIPAHIILDCLADGDTIPEVAARYPAITPEDVSAVLAYAAGLTGG